MSDTAIAVSGRVEAIPGPGPWLGALRGLWRFARRKPLGAVGLSIIVAMVVCAVFADNQLVTLFQRDDPLLAPYYYDDQDIANRLQGPSLSHLFGTDRLGRDMLSQVIYGARTSLLIGLSAVIISMGLATLVGTVSGYLGGKLDLLIQRLVDAWISFPAIVILLTGVQVAKEYAGPSPTTQSAAIVAVLGLVLAAGASRVIRSATLALKNNMFVEAARAVGASDVRIIFRHILPNVMPVVIVLATLQLGAAILAVGTIGFLGFGVPAPFPDWGRMLSTEGLLFMRAHPWLAVWPGLAIFLAVWGLNVFGDALRDVLDPRLRGL
ncbi:MAG: ABC transporter permease [Dehalococcoidia bacterium]|mgnify:FL=1|nr:ABC transporter permease [Dehalococcoidia bacterium]MDW8009308.1 ABC transporter permease [Chloroflexota bacterium]